MLNPESPFSALGSSFCLDCRDPSFPLLFSLYILFLILIFSFLAKHEKTKQNNLSTYFALLIFLETEQVSQNPQVTISEPEMKDPRLS